MTSFSLFCNPQRSRTTRVEDPELFIGEPKSTISGWTLTQILGDTAQAEIACRLGKRDLTYIMMWNIIAIIIHINYGETYAYNTNDSG